MAHFGVYRTRVFSPKLFKLFIPPSLNSLNRLGAQVEAQTIKTIHTALRNPTSLFQKNKSSHNTQRCLVHIYIYIYAHIYVYIYVYVQNSNITPIKSLHILVSILFSIIPIQPPIYTLLCYSIPLYPKSILTYTITYYNILRYTIINHTILYYTIQYTIIFSPTPQWNSGGPDPQRSLRPPRPHPRDGCLATLGDLSRKRLAATIILGEGMGWGLKRKWKLLFRV